MSGNWRAQGSLQGRGLGDLVIRVMKLGRGRVDATIRAASEPA